MLRELDRRAARVLAGVFLVAGGCGRTPDVVAPNGTPPTPITGCPVPAAGRVLVDQAARSILEDAAFQAVHAGPGERGVSLRILGVSWAHTLVARLLPQGQCLGPSPVFDGAFCASAVDRGPTEPFSSAYDGCARFRCEREGVGLVDTFLTLRPRTSPDDRHRLSYEASVPAGRITYDPNPFVTHRLDVTTADRAIVTADIDHRVTFTAGDGPPIDLAHAGTVSVARAGTSIQAASLRLRFSGFPPGGLPVVLTAEIDAAGQATGAVRYADRTLGSVGGHYDFNRELIAWEGDCAPPRAAATSATRPAPRLGLP